MRIVLFIIILLFVACSHNGVIIIEQPKPKNDILVTVKTRYDSIKDNDGEYFRLYKLSNDSIMWIPQYRHLYPGDTLYLKAR